MIYRKLNNADIQGHTKYLATKINLFVSERDVSWKSRKSIIRIYFPKQKKTKTQRTPTQIGENNETVDEYVSLIYLLNKTSRSDHMYR